MSIDHPEASRPLPDRPNLRHLKDQAKDLLKAGAAASITDAQFKIARLYGFASWPKLKAHIDSLEEIGQLKQAIDSNDIGRVKKMMTRNPELHSAPFGYGEDGPYSGRPAYDDLIQGAAAIPSLVADAGGTAPRYVPMNIADRTVGLSAVSSIGMALFHRERTGQGQQIDSTKAN